MTNIVIGFILLSVGIVFVTFGIKLALIPGDVFRFRAKTVKAEIKRNRIITRFASRGI